MVLIDFLNKIIPGEGGKKQPGGCIKKFSHSTRNLAPQLAKILSTSLAKMTHDVTAGY